MEEESFKDVRVAEYLNGHFVAIKVDKEERPDIDAVYMTVCQALTGSGGWPTTILMTHEQKPFFAGTYFPKRSRYGRLGLLELLSSVNNKWETDRESLIESGNRISNALSNNSDAGQGFHMPEKSAVENAVRELRKSYDKQYGGFGVAPKFPMPHNLMFLLRCHSLGVSDDALSMTENTLTQMYKGGIFDHIGFGFSRYSTDPKWLAPHFEKMLYDNALLAIAFLECFEITNNELYKTVAENTLLYLNREMTSESGGFYSAQDADSDGEEGKYYTFTPEEIIQILGKDDARHFCHRYDVSEGGNFEGKSIPNLIGKDSGLLPDSKMRDMIGRLYSYRKNRFTLDTDDKLLTSWSALSIAAHAKAYRVLGDEKYLGHATRALDFISAHMIGENGNLYISYRDGKAKGTGILDDYAFLSWACLELYESSFELCYLEKSCELARKILTSFSDKSVGFFLYAHDSERLLLRPKEQYDGAMPSGNSVAACVLVRLAALTAEKIWIEEADKQLTFYADIFSRQPTACTFALLALMRKVYPARELMCVIANESDKEITVSELRRISVPQLSILIKTPEEAERLAKIAPFAAEYVCPSNKKYAFYLCADGACSAPVHSFDELRQILYSK